jgi:hypothetical protein
MTDHVSLVWFKPEQEPPFSTSVILTSTARWLVYPHVVASGLNLKRTGIMYCFILRIIYSYSYFHLKDFYVDWERMIVPWELN